MATAIVGIVVLFALFFAVKGVLKHFRGESSCCGGGDVKVPKKKLTGTIVATKVVDIEGMTCGHCKARVEQALEKCQDEKITEWSTIKSNVRDALGRYLFDKTRRRPMILPIIMEL